MRSFLGYFVGIGLACAALPARAQAPATLTVERAEGAEACPDSAALAASIAAIRGSASSGTTRYAVTFAREGDVYSTQIRSGPEGTDVRRIEDRGADCSALAQATAVTLALLYDADAARSAETAEPTPVATPAPIAIPAPAPPEHDLHTTPRMQPSLSLGAGALIGVLRPVSPALLADAGVVGNRLRFTLGALFVPAQHLELAPGSVSTWLLSGTARACYAPLRGGAFRLDVCSGFVLGTIKGSSHGFTHTESHTRIFSALPIQVAFAQLGRALGWEIGAELLVPFRRPQFAIENVGVAYDSPPIAALIALRGSVLWPW